MMVRYHVKYSATNIEQHGNTTRYKWRDNTCVTPHTSNSTLERYNDNTSHNGDL